MLSRQWAPSERPWPARAGRKVRPAVGALTLMMERPDQTQGGVSWAATLDGLHSLARMRLERRGCCLCNVEALGLQSRLSFPGLRREGRIRTFSWKEKTRAQQLQGQHPLQLCFRKIRRSTCTQGSLPREARPTRGAGQGWPQAPVQTWPQPLALRAHFQPCGLGSSQRLPLCVFSGLSKAALPRAVLQAEIPDPFQMCAVLAKLRGI